MARIITDEGKEVKVATVYLRDLAPEHRTPEFLGVDPEMVEKAEEEGLDIVVGYFLPSDEFHLE